MKRFLIVAVLTIFGFESFSQTTHTYEYWKLYQVRSGDWLHKLALDLRIQNIPIISNEDLIQQIRERNPEIVNRNRIFVGQKILVPTLPGTNYQHQVVHKKMDHGSEKIQVYNYHYYYNSNVYFANDTPAQSPQQRAPTNFSPPHSLRAKEPLGEAANNLSVEPFFQFSKISSQEKESGLNASLVTDSSFGIKAAFTHSVFKKHSLMYFASLTQESFAKPKTLTALNQGAQNYFQIGTAYLVPLTRKILLSAFLALREKAYILRQTPAVAVSKVRHPVLGLDFNYKFLSFGTSDLLMTTHLAYFLSSSGGDLQVKNGFSYGIGLGYGTQVWGQNFMVSPWFRTHEATTQTSKQSSADLGLSFLWKSSF